MTDDINRADVKRAADDLAAAVTALVAEKTEAQRKLIVACVTLRAIARMENPLIEPMAKAARATLLDLGETW